MRSTGLRFLLSLPSRTRAPSSQLLAEQAIDRVAAAAAQRDDEEDDSHKKHVFVASLGRREAFRQMNGEKSNRHLDRQRGGEESREQADDDTDRADGLQEHRRIGESARRLETVLGHGTRDRAGA